MDIANHLMSKLAPWREDRYDIAEEATLNFMTKVKNGVKGTCGRRGKSYTLVPFKPEHPITMIRFEIIGILYSEKQKAKDDEISLDAYLEERYKKENQ